jgi:hypothetical protein
MEIRRRFARWKVNLPAKVRLAGAEKFINCLLDDISMMGVKIIMPIKLPDEKFVKLTLALSDAFVLNIEAWIGWCKIAEGANTYGLYFTRISDSDKEKIYQYVKSTNSAELERAWWQDFDTDKKESKPMEDKRIFQRFTVKLPVRFLDTASGREGIALTGDVSAKGIGMFVKDKLEPRTPIEIWLEIPDNKEPIYTRGEVVWRSPVGPDEYRIGVSLEKADLMGLSRVLRS